MPVIGAVEMRQARGTAGIVRRRAICFIEMFGWKRASTKGSHARFLKPGERSITVPVHGGKVNRVYLEQICIRLGLDDEIETP